MFIGDGGLGRPVRGPITFNSTTRVVSNDADVQLDHGTVTSAGSGVRLPVRQGGYGLRSLLPATSAGQAGRTDAQWRLLWILTTWSNTAAKIGGGILTLNGGSLVLFRERGTRRHSDDPGPATVMSSAHTDIVRPPPAQSRWPSGRSPAFSAGTVDFALMAGPTFTRHHDNRHDQRLRSGPARRSPPSTAAARGRRPPAAPSPAWPTFGTNLYTAGTNIDVTSESSQCRDHHQLAPVQHGRSYTFAVRREYAPIWAASS